MDVKKEIISALEKAVKDIATGIDVEVSLQEPKDESHGDYSSNIAMAIFAKLKTQNSKLKTTTQSAKLKSPLELAQKIVDSIIHNSSFIILDKVEAVAPGFINFYLSKDVLFDTLRNVSTTKDAFGKGEKLQKKKIVVEYTDPNPFKELHIGHLYSNIIGESLCRIFEASGAEVRRVDYFGDVGMHVAKAIYGLLSKIKNQKSKIKNIKDLEEKPLEERIKFLGEGYALGSNEYAEKESVQKEVQHLNKLIYIAAQRMWQEEKGLAPQVDYVKGESVDQEELDEIYQIYTTGRKWSLEYFETLYKRLGTKFDGYYPESIAGERGYKLVKENLKKNIFVESEGAVIFPGEDYGLHTRVFINKLGLPTYEAKELGLAPWKYEDFPYDMSFIVTATEIAAYFDVLITALKKVNPELGDKTHPVLHGMVNLPEGKMSSRSGNVITVNWLIDEAKRRILASYKEMDNDTAEQVAIAAIKYAFLKSGIGKNITFSFEESISLEGNSGPYLQYTYARTRSVLGKVKSQKSKVKTTIQNVKLSQELYAIRYTLNAEELSLLRTIYRFPEVVADAAQTYSPSTICTYLFDLAQKFNLFYQKCPILESDQKEFRLMLTQATGQVIKNGLNLLGIKAPEHM